MFYVFWPSKASRFMLRLLQLFMVRAASCHQPMLLAHCTESAKSGSTTGEVLLSKGLV